MLLNALGVHTHAMWDVLGLHSGLGDERVNKKGLCGALQRTQISDDNM